MTQKKTRGWRPDNWQELVNSIEPEACCKGETYDYYYFLDGVEDGADAMLKALAATPPDSGITMILGKDIRDGPSLRQAFQDHAMIIGKPVEQLTDAEKKQAWLNAVLAAYEET